MVPYVGDELLRRPNEEGMFLERLQASRLWDSAVEQVTLNQALQQQADEMKARCRLLSSSIFRPGLDRPLWAVLAVHAGLMPPAMVAADDEHENFEYQEPPWEVRNGECVVKGTNRRFEADENGGPVSKYAALFDSRPEFDSLRESFLYAACGKRLERLERSFG